MAAIETEKPISPWVKLFAYAVGVCLVTLPIILIAAAGYVLIHFIIKFW